MRTGERGCVRGRGRKGARVASGCPLSRVGAAAKTWNKGWADRGWRCRRLESDESEAAGRGAWRGWRGMARGTTREDHWRPVSTHSGRGITACPLESAYPGRGSPSKKYGGSFLSDLVNRPPHDQQQDHYMKNVYAARTLARTPRRALQRARPFCSDPHAPDGACWHVTQAGEEHQGFRASWASGTALSAPTERVHVSPPTRGASGTVTASSRRVLPTPVSWPVAAL